MSVCNIIATLPRGNYPTAADYKKADTKLEPNGTYILFSYKFLQKQAMFIRATKATQAYMSNYTNA